LGSIVRYPASVFDLRPILQMLYSLPDAERSAAWMSLMYWADAYDAVICYRTVAPLRSK
jgi:hypothetical protein